MGSQNDGSTVHDESIEVLQRARSRRSFLGGAAVAAGAAALVFPESALAVADGFDGYNNVKDFGATGDGSTDDTTAIRSCINASTAPNPLKTVYFPPGTYRVGTLFVVDNTVLVGHGSLSVLKSKAPALSPMFMNNGDVRDVRIENLKLDGNKAERPEHVNVIQLGSAGSNRISLRRVEVVDSPYASFVLTGADFSVIECSASNGEKDGIAFTGDRALIRGNRIASCIDDHIGLNAAKNVSIVGNLCIADRATMGAGLAVRNGSSKATLVGNVVQGGYRAGIELLAASSAVSDVEIADNVLEEPGKAGLNLQGQRCPTVSGGGSGICVRSGGFPVDGVLIADNIIRAPRYHGILLGSQTASSSLKDVTVVGNKVVIAKDADYLTDGTDPGSGIAYASQPPGIPAPSGPATDMRILDNDVRETCGPGIKAAKHLSGPAPKRVDIQNNRVIDSGKISDPPGNKPGILVDGVVGAMITGNRSQDTRDPGSKAQSYGLQLLNSSGGWLVTNNDVSGNASGGIDASPPVAPPPFENLGSDL
jgi:hypothetical protein